MLSTLLAGSAIAETLDGKVVDTNNEPVAAATVKFFTPSGDYGTITDEQGRFSYELPTQPDSISFLRQDFVNKTVTSLEEITTLTLKPVETKGVTVIYRTPDPTPIITGSPNTNQYYATINPLFDSPSEVTGGSKVASLKVHDGDERGFVYQKRNPLAGAWDGEPAMLSSRSISNGSIDQQTYANDIIIQKETFGTDSLRIETAIKTPASSVKFAIPLGKINDVAVTSESKYVNTTYDELLTLTNTDLPEGSLPNSTEYFQRFFFEKPNSWQLDISGTHRDDGLNLLGEHNGVAGFLDAGELYRDYGFKYERFGKGKLSIAGLYIHNDVTYSNGGEKPFVVRDTPNGSVVFSGHRRAVSDQNFAKVIYDTHVNNLPLKFVVDASLQDATARETTNNMFIVSDSTLIDPEVVMDELVIEQEEAHITTLGAGVAFTKPLPTSDITVGLRFDETISSYQAVQIEPAAEIRWKGPLWNVKLLRHNIYSPGGTNAEKSGLNDGFLTTTTLLGGSYQHKLFNGWLKTEAFGSLLHAVEQHGEPKNGYSGGIATQYIQDMGQWRGRLQGSATTTRIGTPGQRKHLLPDDTPLSFGANITGPITENWQLFAGIHLQEGKPYTGANLGSLHVQGIGEVPHLLYEGENMRRNPWVQKISIGTSYQLPNSIIPERMGSLTIAGSVTDLGAICGWNDAPITRKKYLLDNVESGAEIRTITSREQPLLNAGLTYRY